MVSLSSTYVDIPYNDNRKPPCEYTSYVKKTENYSLIIDNWDLICKIESHSSIKLYVKAVHSESMHVYVTAFVSVENSSIEERFTVSLSSDGTVYLGQISYNDKLPQHHIRIRCHAKFKFYVTYTETEEKSLTFGNDVFARCQNKNTDAEIHVDNKVVQIHRGYFGMLSPVFYAMFNHDTEEKRTGVVKVTDLDFTAVKNAVDFCYGHNLTNKTTSELLNVFVFGDKYDIEVIVEKVGDWIMSILNPFNFCLILNCAYATSNIDLKNYCAGYYRDNLDPIALTPEFAGLEKEVLHDLIEISRFL